MVYYFKSSRRRHGERQTQRRNSRRRVVRNPTRVTESVTGNGHGQIDLQDHWGGHQFGVYDNQALPVFNTDEPDLTSPTWKGTNKGVTCIVQLGRHGDIINILPIAKAIYDQTGIKPALLVSAEFAETVRMVSYVRVEVWNGPYDRVVPAWQWAKEHFPGVLLTQVNTEDYRVHEIKCQSFVQEQWRVAGFLDQWDRLPLLVDLRRPDKELELVDWYVGRKPVILLNLGGHSSPYIDRNEFRESIRRKWRGQFDIIDLEGIRVERLSDFLGLYDVAAGMITTDTATLHLARASSIPVIALITDYPSSWNGTKPRGNIAHSVRYSEALPNIDRIHETISQWAPIRFRHVYSYFSDLKKAYSYSLAKDSWSVQARKHNWEIFPVTNDRVRRVFREGKRRLPYIRDLIDVAARGLLDEDVIVLTNADNVLSLDAGEVFKAKFSEVDACFSRRYDFVHLDHPPNREEIERGSEYLGCDLFAFRKRWWDQYRHLLPDMVFGCENWDWAFRLLVEKSHPYHTTECRIVVGHIWHERSWDDKKTKREGTLTNVAAVDAAFRHDRLNRIRKTVRSDADRIRSFYRHIVPYEREPVPEDIENYLFSSGPHGLGDITMLTSVSEASHRLGRHQPVDCSAPFFKDLMHYNPYYQPPKHDWHDWLSVGSVAAERETGNGHFVQRIYRAVGAEPPLKPKACLKTPKSRVPGRMAFHVFRPGMAATDQARFLHNRPREVYVETIKLLERFIARHWEMEFFQVGRKHVSLNGAQPVDTPSVRSLVEFLATCEWFIGIMSGPLHIATALGVKCIVLVNFPPANRIYLPTMVPIEQAESEWFYPQHVHLHEEGDGELVKEVSERNLEKAIEGCIYPYWSDDYLKLAFEDV